MNGVTPLNTINHSRDSAGLRYIYPVFSRRSGGLSVGVNLNPNNACNWRCVYCQVPGLVRGASPAIELTLLEKELSSLLTDIQSGEFHKRYWLPENNTLIRDIAISGNGEPTSCREFGEVLAIVGRVCARFGSLASLKKILITNGSLIMRVPVQRGLSDWSAQGGEVWFKLDSATTSGIRRINNVNLSVPKMLRNLETCARLCPTWIQTCLFAMDGNPPDETELAAYLDLLATVRRWDAPVKGVLLYGLARPSLQREADRLSALPRAWLDDLGDRVKAIGFPVQVHA